MRTLGGFAIALAAVTCLSAQNRTGFVNFRSITRTPGSVVFPGGTSALPGVIRTTGSVVYPGGGGSQIAIPSAITNVNLGVRPVRPGFNHPQRRPHGVTTVYAYPVYVPNYYDGSYFTEPPPPAAQQPNIVVIYPPQQAPVIVNGSGQDYTRQPLTLYQPEATASPEPASAAEAPAASPFYLIAFKNNTIYSAVAYWVDGDTLHYFTSGNTHNQASISLIDRELTARLNRESGVEVKLPPAK
jgi:hypothetical protein